jgi:hypothetical protein
MKRKKHTGMVGSRGTENKVDDEDIVLEGA